MKITEGYEGAERILPSGAMAELAGLNRDYLDLLIAAPTGESASLPPAVLDGLRRASPLALDAMSACSYSLFLIEARHVTAVDNPAPHGVHDPVAKRYGSGMLDGGAWPSFTMAALSFAWQLCRQNAMSARVMLGFPEETAVALAATDLWRLRSIAARQVLPLQPRWSGNPCFWPDLLRSAFALDPLRLDLARLLGVQLQAADLHASPTGRERRRG
ncbi:MAG: hypothetical protein ABL964_14970 [Steroidobacteraceae bacterium]